jgi:uncharacterized protein (DUF433 family)
MYIKDVHKRTFLPRRGTVEGKESYLIACWQVSQEVKGPIALNWHRWWAIDAGKGMNSMDSVIVKNPEILGGMAIFRGTRVPIQNLFDYLEGGETLEDFLKGFPTVSREAALAALEEAKHLLLARS